MLLASVYQSQKDQAAAVREAGNAIRVDAKSVEARLFLGSLLEGEKPTNKAMTVYQEALRLKPDDAAAQPPA